MCSTLSMIVICTFTDSNIWIYIGYMFITEEKNNIIIKLISSKTPISLLMYLQGVTIICDSNRLTVLRAYLGKVRKTNKNKDSYLEKIFVQIQISESRRTLRRDSERYRNFGHHYITWSVMYTHIQMLC